MMFKKLKGVKLFDATIDELLVILKWEFSAGEMHIQLYTSLFCNESSYYNIKRCLCVKTFFLKHTHIQVSSQNSPFLTTQRYIPGDSCLLRKIKK